MSNIPKSNPGKPAQTYGEIANAAFANLCDSLKSLSPEIQKIKEQLAQLDAKVKAQQSTAE